MFKCLDVQMFRCSDVEMLNCSNAQMFKLGLLRLLFKRLLPRLFLVRPQCPFRYQIVISAKPPKHELKACKNSENL